MAPGDAPFGTLGPEERLEDRLHVCPIHHRTEVVHADDPAVVDDPARRQGTFSTFSIPNKYFLKTISEFKIYFKSFFFNYFFQYRVVFNIL